MDDKNNKIARFGSMLYAPELPAFYNQGLTYYEILVRLASVINNNAEIMNSWQKTAEELEKILSDTDKIIKEKVIEVIQSMYESGELNAILKSVLESYLNNNFPINGELDFKRVYRGLYNIGDNYRFIDTSVITPSFVQSGTYIESYNGVSYYIYCIIPSGVYSHGYTNAGCIVAINANTLYPAGAVAVEMEHMNACDFNPLDEYLYIAGCLNYTLPDDDSDNPSAKLYRIHIDEIIANNKGGLNKNFTNTGQLSAASFYQPTYETRDLRNIAGFAGVSTNHVSYNNNLLANQIYVGTSYARIYVYDWVNNAIMEEVTNSTLNTKVAQIFNNSGSMVMQTASVFKNYLFVVTTKPNCIIRCNIDTSEIEYIYNIPQILNNGYFAVGEVESIKILNNGDIFLFSNFDMFQTKFRQYRQTQIFKSNIYNSIAFETIPNKHEPLTIYVDRFARPSDHGNPTGDASNPFHQIHEAVSFANNNNVTEALNIEMKSNSNFAVEITTNKKICIEKAQTVSEQGENYDKMTIGGAALSGANNVIFDNISVHYSYPDGVISGYIQAWQSHVVLNNVYFARATGIISVEPAIRLTYSSGILAGSGKFTVENGKETATNGLPWGGSSFITANVSSFNAHGWATTNLNVFI